MTASNNEAALETLAGIVREHVQALLDNGHPASSVSFVLAFVATELGLELASNPHEPIRVVLGAVLNASSQHAKAQSREDLEVSDEVERPSATTIH